MIQLDIGCAQHKLNGWIGIDLESGPEVDVIADLHALPFRTSSIDRIHTRHTLEHVKDLLVCISELYRVCQPGGRITVIVPHFTCSAYWSDPTHLRPFSIRSFEYYDLDHAGRAGFPIYLPDVNLRTRKVHLTYWPKRNYLGKGLLKRMILSVVNPMISGVANICPFFCERIWCKWVGGFDDVTFELEAAKKSVNKINK
ncbi:methyltransferase domain-containing protein [bacterium]|nr:methyltransferase domain-containing protein [bacterium]